MIKAVFLGAIVAALGVWCLGCPSGENCTDNDHTICKATGTYWVDSCGIEGDLAEACDCGCNADYTGCEQECCTPDCEGKDCGDDGCGGTCAPGCEELPSVYCSEAGQCVDDCEGRQCGLSPELGGNCGPGCEALEVCNQDGQCLPCAPDCTDRECGDDGCGGSCAPDCDAPEVCSPEGLCVAQTCPGAIRMLAVGSDPNVTLYPQESVELKVVFVEQCSGAVAGEVILFEIIGNPGGSGLSDSTAITGANGLAVVSLTAGDQVGPFQVRALHPDDPDGVYFSVSLQPVLQQVYPVGPTQLSTYTNESVDLAVRLLNVDTNSPVNGTDVEFIINQPAPGDASIPAPVDRTNLSGLATTPFFAGSTVTTYLVVASGQSENLGTVTYSIQVRSRTACQNDNDCPPGHNCISGACFEPYGDECNTNDQCPANYACEDGYCRPEGVLPDSCDTSEDCPAGYFCENHRCYQCPEQNPPPECEGGGEGCETYADCPPGFVCRNGVCYPDNPDDVIIPELGGRWYTEHYFDIRDALPDFTAPIADIASTLNQAINFCEFTGIGFVDDFLCGLVCEMVPPWVPDLLNILDNLSNTLAELRAEGVMELNHINPRELLSGSEQWDRTNIRYLDACCAGQGAGCNPHNQPDFPNCATITLSRQDLALADVGIVVHPFSARVNVDDSGAFTVYTLAVDERRVEIEYSKLVVLLVDLLVQIHTQYDDLDDALADIIDCQAIQNLVDAVWHSELGPNPPDVIQACENLKPSASQLLEGLLNLIGVGWKTLRVDGWATITTMPGDPPFATELGYENHEQGADGTWDGTFNIAFDADITGAWHADR